MTKAVPELLVAGCRRCKQSDMTVCVCVCVADLCLPASRDLGAHRAAQVTYVSPSIAAHKAALSLPASL